LVYTYLAIGIGADFLKILIVDDEESMRTFLTVALENDGHEVTSADGLQTGLKAFREGQPDLILQDVKMPDGSGLELLKEVKKDSPKTAVVVMTAFSTWESAVEAMRLGAYDFVKKPFDTENIKATVNRALEMSALGAGKSAGKPKGWEVVSVSEIMNRVRDQVLRVAPTNSTVLIQGESGTGKELVARALHSQSLRADQEFVSVNCGAFSESLLESELFGHKKGAFTGAFMDKKGLVTVADGGTFFLDEVSEMSMGLQVKLLRLLEEREYMPVGDNRTHKVDTRFITATNRNLLEEVGKGTFREDLYYRLNVIPIQLPPLRERRDDIPLLAGHFLGIYAVKMNSTVKSMSEAFMQALRNHDWPGNVRELENAIQRAVALAQGDELGVEDLDDRLRSVKAATLEPTQEISIPEGGMDLVQTLEDLERKYIEQALTQTKGNLTQAAALLGMTFRSIRYKLKKLEINL